MEWPEPSKSCSVLVGFQVAAKMGPPSENAGSASDMRACNRLALKRDQGTSMDRGFKMLMEPNAPAAFRALVRSSLDE